MRPDEIVVGRDYILEDCEDKRLVGSIVSVIEHPAAKPYHCGRCKCDKLTISSPQIYGGDEIIACPCFLHPITDPDTAQSTEETEQIGEVV